MKKEVLPLLTRDVLRAAEMGWLARHSFRDPDRLGRYAALYLENCPPGAVILCLMDAQYRLTAVHLLASGPRAELARFAPQIPPLFKASGASCAAVCFTPRAEEYGYTGEDDRIAARLALYCKQQGVPLTECIVAWLNGYEALFRKYDYKM